LRKRRDQKSEIREKKRKPRINTEIAEDTEDAEVRKEKTEKRRQEGEENGEGHLRERAGIAPLSLVLACPRKREKNQKRRNGPKEMRGL